MKDQISIRALAVVCAVGFIANGAMAEEEEDKTGWAGEISLSGAAQTGTTDTLSGTADGSIERTFEKDKLGARLTATYGNSSSRDSDKETTQDSQQLLGDWTRVIHDRFFWDSRTELSRDSTQDRKIRFAVNSGPGYRFWQGEDGPKEHFDLSAGVGYRYEVYDGNSNTGGDNTDIDQFADIVGRFEYKNMLFDDKIEFTHTGGIAFPANAPEAYVLRTEAIIGVPLTAAWSFRTGFLAEYTPAAPPDTNKVMTRTTIGIGYKF